MCVYEWSIAADFSAVVACRVQRAAASDKVLSERHRETQRDARKSTSKMGGKGSKK